MRIDELTTQHFFEILKLYHTHLHIGQPTYVKYLEDKLPREWFDDTINDTITTIKKMGSEQLRIGNEYDANGKITFTNNKGDLEVKINVNFDPKHRSGKLWDEAKAAEKKFITAVNNYLLGK